MDPKVLELKNVAAGYDGVDVIKNISLRVKPNENLSIIGPNGCGKTTLLKAIVNLLPFKGEIKINERLVHTMKPKEISLEIAMLSQTSATYFSYSVYDTVMMGRYLHMQDRFFRLPSKKDHDYVLQCLETVDLLNEKDREISTLSGGQLQRVFLARVLAQNPKIILLDEPTNHLDLKYQVELIEYLRKWSKQGERAVIGVLHDLNLALQLSDQILVMKDGEAKAYGKPGTILTGKLLEETYEIDVVGYMRDSLRTWEDLKK